MDRGFDPALLPEPVLDQGDPAMGFFQADIRREAQVKGQFHVISVAV
jgi:hypothetical protein